MILVVDASVALRWFLRAPHDERDTERAMAILEALDRGSVGLVQPPHFLAEVAAVLTRKKPDDAQDDLGDLRELDWQLTDEPGIYATAIELSVNLGQHVFDTLYHATALHEPDAHLVTADGRYFQKAASLGRIVPLGGLELPGG